ncbi:DNA repair protein [Actibacterium lipolyticum]|uniref:DNA repair protein n=1 Tax=Actibacterium lipolyticum TaxID=1524263 RepID=A0A238JWX7_9RHOB|nr:DNA repair protein [Actibacterium lipolyticum]SMX34216.1 hypothetical protein COL8621_01217 [Actibacterium lipolyticum]
MTSTSVTNLFTLQRIAQKFCLVFIAITAVSLVIASVLAGFGVLPWLSFSASYGDTVFTNAGMIAQLGLTALMLALCIFIPSGNRVMALENSHRDFAVRMDDVANAYRASHAADREGVFALSSEFDNMRERITHMRNHPDLGRLEPELLDLAAQMSFQSRDLATVYSDEKVNRARTFLQQRQEELTALGENIGLARQTTDELRRWMQEVSVEEALIEKQMESLTADLSELLPAIGYGLKPANETGANIVPIAAKTAE